MRRIHLRRLLAVDSFPDHVLTPEEEAEGEYGDDDFILDIQELRADGTLGPVDRITIGPDGTRRTSSD